LINNKNFKNIFETVHFILQLSTRNQWHLAYLDRIYLLYFR